MTHITFLEKTIRIMNATLIAICSLSLTGCIEKKEETTKEVVQPVPGPEKLVPVPVPGPEKVQPVPVPVPAPQQSK